MAGNWAKTGRARAVHKAGNPDRTPRALSRAAGIAARPRVFPGDTSDDECLLAEIQENNARKELTGAERKAFAAEVGRLIANLSKNCQELSFANGKTKSDGNWVEDLAKTTNTPPKTIYNWWSSFCAESALSITPKQATTEHRAAFFDWLERHKAEALASYARQSKDDTLRKMADRIQARAIRRCGELLKQIETQPGKRTDLEPSEGSLTRSEAANEAGLSRHQKVTALRVASVRMSHAAPEKSDKTGRFPAPACTSRTTPALRLSALAGRDYFPAVRRKPAPTRHPPTLPGGKFKIIPIIMNNHANNSCHIFCMVLR